MEVGQIVMHNPSGSMWIVVDTYTGEEAHVGTVNRMKISKHFKGYCLYTGKDKEGYWRVNKLDDWFMNDRHTEENDNRWTIV